MVVVAAAALVAGASFGGYEFVASVRAMQRQAGIDRAAIATLAGQLATLRDQSKAQQDAAAADRLTTRDAYLGLAEVTVDADRKAYTPQFVARVRYTGEAFAPKGGILLTRRLTPADQDVIWSEAFPLEPGDELELLDDRFHDLRAGTTFVKVRRMRDQLTGYLTLQTFVGETTPAGDLPQPREQLTSSIDGLPILLISPTTADSALRGAQLIDGVSLAKAYAVPISKGQVHPVTAGNWLLAMLLGLTVPGPDEATHQRTLAAARRVFDEYVLPAKVEVKPGAIAWPNTYDFAVPWGATLKAPWFSGYSNAVIANAAALMFRLTGEAKYAEIARQGVAWLRLPVEQGGALYHDGPFIFAAEYPSNAPAQPNVGVLDGEMVAAIAVYNTAVLLGDSDMLRFAARLAYSLVNKTNLATSADGRIQNARYQWLIDNDGYLNPMKRWAAQLGMITKDKRLFAHAASWRKSDVYWPAN